MQSGINECLMENETFQTVSFLNTGVPLLVIAACAIALPLLLVPRATRSQRRVTVRMALCALLLTLISAGVFGYARLHGTELTTVVGSRWAAVPVLIWWMVLESLIGVIVWAPILALMWLVAAQRVERLKGEDMAREAGA